MGTPGREKGAFQSKYHQANRDETTQFIYGFEDGAVLHQHGKTSSFSRLEVVTV